MADKSSWLLRRQNKGSDLKNNALYSNHPTTFTNPVLVAVAAAVNNLNYRIITIVMMFNIWAHNDNIDIVQRRQSDDQLSKTTNPILLD